MTKYRALTTSYHNNQLLEAGDVVDIDESKMDIGPNYELADRSAPPKKSNTPPASPAVESLINSVRMHAATRGVTPDLVNETDFDVVLDATSPKPSAETIKAAADKLGVKLGSSVA